MRCPSCHTESGGRFCPECGTALSPAACRACGAEAPAGARFCVTCGEAVDRNGNGPRSAVSWAGAGVAIAVMLTVFVLPALRPAAAPPPPAATAAGQPGGASPPPLSGTPREQADRLFNRVMEAFARGDTSEAEFFLPMAIDAYGLVDRLDADGLFHLSLLETAAGDPGAGRSAAERILEAEPDHLLALAAAAQAAREMDDADAARAFYEHFLRVYDAETARDTPEYAEHAPMLPFFLDEARSYLAR